MKHNPCPLIYPIISNLSTLGRYSVSTLKNGFPRCAGLKKLDIFKQPERCSFRHLGLLAKDILAERRSQNQATTLDFLFSGRGNY